jgi:tRNA1Val (adenine37-N6)-methyltransferase
MFRFKQFTIHQQHCAQKVSEVACIQGAWTTAPDTCQRILDIGSGTGLLTLMLAQRYTVPIDAIELDEAAFKQGCENVNASPFHNRIHCTQGDVLQLSFTHRYDLIICNPPFFSNQLRSPNAQSNVAKHSTHLDLPSLLQRVDSLLSDDGCCSLLLPVNRNTELLDLCAQFSLRPQHILRICHSEAHASKVMIVMLHKKELSFTASDFYVHQANGDYTPAMQQLISAYYL